MASPQLENGHTRIANEIMDEVIRRNFSKRQKDILHLIWRLSYGFGKKTALIPKMKHFTLCGVTKQNVKAELEHLETCKVISWERETNRFTFNKNHEEWIITPGKGFDSEDYKELVNLNIQEKFLKQEQNGSQNKNNSKAEHERSSQNKNKEVLKIRTFEFLKQEPLQGSIPSLSKVKRLSKAMFKTSIKAITTTATTYAHEEKSFVDAGTPETVTKEVASTSSILLDRYLELKGALQATPKDQMAANEVQQAGVPPEDAVRYLEEKFSEYERKKKHKHDRINGLGYCVGYILDKHYEQKEAESGAKYTGRTPKSGASRTYSPRKGKSPADLERQREQAERAFGYSRMP